MTDKNPNALPPIPLSMALPIARLIDSIDVHTCLMVDVLEVQPKSDAQINNFCTTHGLRQQPNDVPSSGLHRSHQVAPFELARSPSVLYPTPPPAHRAPRGSSAKSAATAKQVAPTEGSKTAPATLFFPEMYFEKRCVTTFLERRRRRGAVL